MDWQQLFNWVVPGVGTLMAWYTRHVQNEQKAVQASHSALQAQFNDFRVKVASEYATNHDLAGIDTKLDRILERLDRKADK